MESTQVAVDLAKSVFEIAVSHEVGQVAEGRAMGHRVRLLPAGDVRRYRDGDKTDRTDACWEEAGSGHP
jgi:hypothetical protein